MSSSSRFATLIARVPPLVRAASLLCLGLAAYTPLLRVEAWRIWISAGLLVVLAGLLPWLLDRKRQDDWMAALLIAVSCLAVVLLSEASSALWLLLIVAALSVATVLSGWRIWAVLAAVWAIWAAVALNTPTVSMRTLLPDLVLRGAMLALVAYWARTAIRVPPVSVAKTSSAGSATPTIQRLTRACDRLRTTTRRRDIFEELVSAAKAVGPFEYAAIANVDWRAGLVTLEVVLGASGQTLGASEGIDLTWSEIAPLWREDQRVGDRAFLVDQLPFRALESERYVLLPLHNNANEIIGLLAIGAEEPNAKERLSEAVPLLELLAAQGATALETTSMQSRLAQRLEQTAAEMSSANEDAQRARWQAENLYHIVRALSTTLDPQQLLDQALILIAQATQAERGGIMLAEQRSGRLMFGTNMDRHLTKSEAAALERGQGLAGWVMEHKSIAIIPNTAEDERWLVRSEHDAMGRSALAVPLDHDGTAIGVIILINNGVGHFTSEHAQFVQVIGDQVATMLINARQHQELQDKANRLGQLLEQREEEASKSLAILRSIGDGVVVGDRLGRIRLVNPAAERLLNIESQKYLGQSLIALPGPIDIDHNPPSDEDFQEFEVNGRIIRAFNTPVVTNDDEWLGSVLVYHDVSATQLADRLKTEFVATASHELRTPLTSIGGYIDLLLLNTLGPINEQQRQFLSVVKLNIERLTAILNDLLDMSRIEAGNVRLQRRPINLEEILHPLVLELHQKWSTKNISLALDMPGDLPQVIADTDRVRQILYNLLSNAYKYTYEHGRIDLIVRNGGQKITITVRDTGVGIAERDKEHIFTRFYRTENPLKEQAGGTGLGLTITKSLVELHGGRIWFESAEGKGSTFVVELPVGGDADWTPAAWLEGVE